MGLLEKAIGEISGQDGTARKRAEERIAALTMPTRALGRLCDLGVDLAGMTGKMPPPVSRRRIVVMAGDHGVAAAGVSAYPPEVTGQMVANFAAGGAGVNVLARLNGAGVTVVDMGMAVRDEDLVKSGKILDRSVGRGTANLAEGPAMTRERAVASMEAGIALAWELADSTDVFGTGEMGIGNTTPATAMASVFTGLPVASLCGRGTGIDDRRLAMKIELIEKALRLNKPDPADAVDVLAKVGGFEIGGIAGLILGCAARKKPVFVDGFISGAGAMVAKAAAPKAMDFAVAAHGSAEPGHAAMCEWLGKTPLLQLNMRLGEGTGAALAMNLAEASARILTEMATFDSASVTGTKI